MKLYYNRETQADAAVYERETGFSENWSGALGLAIMEDLPVTSRMVSTTVESQRKKRIFDYTASGEIPQSVAQFYGGDTNGLAKYARDVLGLDGFTTDEDYQDQREQEYKLHRDFSKDTFSKQTFMGAVGEAVGYLHAMPLDPIYAASMLTGYGTAATMGQAIIRTAAIEAGIEAVAQVPKMSWKEEVGAEVSGANALTEIAFAGMGAGALVGLGKGIGKVLGPKDLTVGQVVESFESLAKDNPELAPVLNTIKNADPEENLSKVLEADEAIDIRRADEGPLRVDEKAASDLKEADYTKAEEEIFAKRQPTKIEVATKKEGVPRGTPTEEVPDTRHPMVVEADNKVVRIDDTIKLMEECF